MTNDFYYRYLKSFNRSLTMKKATVFLLTFICIMAFAGSAVAYDDLINDYTYAVKARSLNIQGQFLYLTASEAFDKDGEKVDADATHIRIPIRVRYGITDKLNVSGILPIVSIGNGDTETGIGDVWLGLKYRLNAMGLLLRPRIDVNLPFGDDDKGLGNPGGIGVDAGINIWKFVTKTFSISGKAGLRSVSEDSDTKWKPGLMFYVCPAVRYRIRRGLFVGTVLETIIGSDGQLDGTDVNDSAVNSFQPWFFVDYMLPAGMMLTGSVVYTVSGKNTSADTGLWIRLHKNLSF